MRKFLLGAIFALTLIAPALGPIGPVEVAILLVIWVVELVALFVWAIPRDRRQQEADA